jgi:hypothetical protein
MSEALDSDMQRTSESPGHLHSEMKGQALHSFIHSLCLGHSEMKEQALHAPDNRSSDPTRVRSHSLTIAPLIQHGSVLTL